MSDKLGRSTSAFAPGHVTGIFRPEMRARDPRARGSVGAGIVLELGVWAHARLTPGRATRVRVVGDGPGPWPISEDAARRLSVGLSGTVTVRLSHELPVGQGFGMSAAGALATSLAVGALSGVPRTRVLEVAHLADLFGGGGLGGVAAILGGGLELRQRAGIPPFGRVAHRPFHAPILVGVVGRPIPSSSILSDPVALDRISRASRGWEALSENADPGRFFRLSERFTDRAGLSPVPVTRAVRALRRRGAWAAQAMFGGSFFALPRSASARDECLRWLRRKSLRVVEIRPAASGARLVPVRSG